MHEDSSIKTQSDAKLACRRYWQTIVITHLTSIVMMSVPSTWGLCWPACQTSQRLTHFQKGKVHVISLQKGDKLCWWSHIQCSLKDWCALMLKPMLAHSFNLASSHWCGDYSIWWLIRCLVNWGVVVTQCQCSISPYSCSGNGPIVTKMQVLAHVDLISFLL